MTSFPVRDQTNDHLLTPKNLALIIIDYEPAQVNAIASMDRHLLVDNRVTSGNDRQNIRFTHCFVNS